MSRIGKRIISIPEKTNIEIEHNHITVVGPKGTLKREFSNLFKYQIKDDSLTVTPKNSQSLNLNGRKLWGTTNSHIFNMICGVTQGYAKELKIIGVGYRCMKKDNLLTFQLGYSHQIEKKIPAGIEVEVLRQTTLKISGFDKELVGQFAAQIRDLRRPEPYRGKGIRYVDEHVISKEGKKAGK